MTSTLTCVYPPIPLDATEFELTDEEQWQVDALLRDVSARFGSADDPDLVGDLRLFAAQLPQRLVRAIERYRLGEPAAALIIRRLPVDDDSVGPTPQHWSRQPDPKSTLREELYLMMVGSLLGDLFGWSTLQKGRLIQNVHPIAGDETQQNGHSSEVVLEWHTEDGFHPYRCDYLGLMGVRNEDAVPTTFSSIRRLDLPEEMRSVLSEERFLIRPDDEHLRNQPTTLLHGEASVQRIGTQPEPVAVLFGSPERPYLRIDPYFMSATPGDDVAECALRDLIDQLDRNLEDIILMPGDVVFVDNYLAVHGRKPFRSRYNGRDRWLKKVTVTRDLRKSRGIRAAANSRVLV